MKHLDYESDQNIYHAVRAVRTTASGGHAYEYAFFELPVQSCGRFVRLPDRDGKSYIMYLDDVVRCSLPKIFAGSDAHPSNPMHSSSRGIAMEIDDDQRSGILQKISKRAEKQEERREALRVVYDGNMPQTC